jgi:hypothetical protein
MNYCFNIIALEAGLLEWAFWKLTRVIFYAFIKVSGEKNAVWSKLAPNNFKTTYNLLIMSQLI